MSNKETSNCSNINIFKNDEAEKICSFNQYFTFEDYEIEHFIHYVSCSIIIGTMKGEKFIYTANLPHIKSIKDVKELGKFTIKLSPSNKLIYPASKKHYEKYFKINQYQKETYEEYENKTALNIDWLERIITGESKGEKIYVQDEHILVIKDIKWNEENDDFYLVCFFKDNKLKTIRDLNDTNLLRKCKRKIIDFCVKTFSCKEEDICMCFHYRPSYNRLHMHVINISRNLKWLKINGFRNILLDDVIRNIEIDKEYYKRDLYIISNE
ncbi:m7GpppX [Nucleospora cyclopteri]